MISKIQTLLEEAAKTENFSSDEMSSVASAKCVFPNESEATNAFARFSEKLFQINRWNSHSVITSFELFEKNGVAASRKTAKAGDFIRISMTGTGKSDWVKITSIDDSSPNEIILIVQPTYDPTDEKPDKTHTSHFFKSESNNNFCLQKKDETINFYVIGLNEKSNIEDTKNIIEAARNIATANFGHYLGIQKAEWSAFCKNFLEISDSK